MSVAHLDELQDVTFDYSLNLRCINWDESLGLKVCWATRNGYKKLNYKKVLTKNECKTIS